MTTKRRVQVLKIAIIGCGAIGTSLAKAVTRDFRGKARVCSLFDIDGTKSLRLATLLKKPALAVFDLKQAVRTADLVVEAAHANSSFRIAQAALSAGKDVMVMSVGGVVDGMMRLVRLAGRKNARIYIPSGAVCGIDALKAMNPGTVKKVSLTTRKHPMSFSNVKYIQERAIDVKKIKKDTVLFSGSARQAMKFFPQNVNVAGVLSLAGIGPDKTKVMIIASPKAARNIHEIFIEAEAGTITTLTENVLHPDNPKTSFLAVLSALARIRQMVEPLAVGT